MMGVPGVVLEYFGARVAGALGGRLNQHWLVEARGRQLVLRRWWQDAASIDYELRLVERVAALGWPVAPALDRPVELEGAFWSLAPFLPGQPPVAAGSAAEQRARGRLLARFHADLAQLGDVGQRQPWRRCEAILGDATLDELLTAHEREQPDEICILRWHVERARQRIADLRPEYRPAIVIHGDFTPWNLRFQEGRLSAILDFELAHEDHRVGDFALAWRGKYDQVIAGYHEVSPLEPEEWALITPMWWAFLIDQAWYHLRTATRDDGWLMRKLLERSPLMGPDAAALP
jgi:Ser/Thr protein kinase RdoA (MazF antagonist)